MNSCEIASTVTALSCAIAKCVPKEDLPLLTSILGQIASTLATISIVEESKESNRNLQVPIDTSSSEIILTRSDN